MIDGKLRRGIYTQDRPSSGERIYAPIRNPECNESNCRPNYITSVWRLLKRGIGGTYISVEPFHLFRYVDEQAFRYNTRGPMNDWMRFRYAMRKIVGKRLTYKELTGKREKRMRNSPKLSKLE